MARVEAQKKADERYKNLLAKQAQTKAAEAEAPPRVPDEFHEITGRTSNSKGKGFKGWEPKPNPNPN